MEEAGDIANRVTMYMVLLGFFFFVFALFAMFYFPHYITEPIESMTQSIQQISQKNYSERLVINHSDELGDMAKAINKLLSSVQAAFKEAIRSSRKIQQSVQQKQKIQKKYKTSKKSTHTPKNETHFTRFQSFLALVSLIL